LTFATAKDDLQANPPDVFIEQNTKIDKEPAILKNDGSARRHTRWVGRFDTTN